MSTKEKTCCESDCPDCPWKTGAKPPDDKTHNPNCQKFLVVAPWLISYY